MIERLFANNFDNIDVVDLLHNTDWRVEDALRRTHRVKSYSCNIKDYTTGETIFSGTYSFPETFSDTEASIVAQKYMNGWHTDYLSFVTEVTRAIAYDLASNHISTLHKELGVELGLEAAKCVVHFKLAHMVLSRYATWNSPVWFNVGREDVPGVMACYILRTEDSMESILDRVRVEGEIFCKGAGAGSNESLLRSSFEPITGGGRSSGPTSFMSGWDKFGGIIKSGGCSRRAARMEILEDNHPDVFHEEFDPNDHTVYYDPSKQCDFIRMKQVEENKARVLAQAGYSPSIGGPITDSLNYQNCNSSIRFHDDFMDNVVRYKAGVIESFEWELVGRGNKDYARVVDGVKMWKAFEQAAWECADPGAQFHDTFNDWFMTPSAGIQRGTNPCVTGDTLVSTEDGWQRIDSIVGTPIKVVGSDGKLHQTNGSFKTGKQLVYSLTTKWGIRLNLTADHKVLTTVGDVPAKDLTNKHCIYTSVELSSDLISDKYFESFVSPNDYFESIVELGERDVYDLTEPETNHFVANGLVVHNCSEYSGPDNTSCNLAALNVLLLKNKHQVFQDCVMLLTMTCNSFLDVCWYPTEEIKKQSLKYRTIGIGLTNLGALLLHENVGYGSLDGQSIARQVMAAIDSHVMLCSGELANYLGGAPGWTLEDVDVVQCLLDRKINACHPHTEVHEYSGFPYPVYAQCSDVVETYANTFFTVIAPVGTTGFMLGNDTTGCEPFLGFSLKKDLAGGGTVDVSFGRFSSIPEHIKAILKADESLDDAAENGIIKRNEAATYKTALGRNALTPEDHVNMLAALQPFVSGAISKTVNVPENTTPEQIGDIFILAWKQGVKAVAVYRDNCKVSQVLTLKNKPASNSALVVEQALKRKRPPSGRETRTFTVTVANTKIHFTVWIDESGEPAELFFKAGEVGDTVHGFADILFRVFSIARQYGVPYDELIKPLLGVEFSPKGSTDLPGILSVKSIPDAIAQVLLTNYPPKDIVSSDPKVIRYVHVRENSNYYKPLDKEIGTAGKCPRCSAPLYRSPGSVRCVSCFNCGYSDGDCAG